uniref:Coiled-coil domain-containing glutamate-rich protein 2 n=1 Tax=Geotrypetes seraphini TaxID=260995 RepID=A0A6P8RW11_GEOSA|nr:coiled-coil domain-containing glutamate-rich protein 2 [Geotrypetes seraphini]
MISAGCFLLVCLGLQVNSVPLSTRLSEEEEKVTQCIVEVLVDSVSKPSPGEVSSECLKILKEDERVLAMMHHQHFLKELEDMAHRENSKHRLGHEGGHSMWESEKNKDEDLKKRDAEAASKRTSAEGNGQEELKTKDAESKQEREDVKEFEKSKTIEETIKEHKVSEGEKETRELLEEAKEFLEDEEKKKRNSPDKVEKKNKGFQLNEMLERHHTSKRTGGIKRLFSDEEGSLENGEKYHHGEFLGNHHHHLHHHQDHHGNHQDWEKEEDKRSGVQPKSIHKRMDEKASDEETAQFEAEEKGVKVSDSKTHLHGIHGDQHLDSNLWEDKRHSHRHQADSEDEELRKRHHEEEPHHKNMHLNHETEEEEEEEEEEEVEEEEEEREEEEKEEEENEERELEDLKDIEFELKKAAEKLGELQRG